MDNIAISRKQLGGESPMVASEVFDSCIYTGLFGTIDSARMEAITAKLTDMVESSNSDFVVIDLSNVDAIDTSVASQLVRAADTIVLVGAKPVFCGLRGVIARTMSSAGVALGRHLIVRDLKAATKFCIQESGYALVPTAPTRSNEEY
ncbi:STAS domain-containing protein [Vibrio sp. Isolate25]|uniref:STAS domain-containing protein n=1 Tax=unclassified Vibrio TaxID=2614977 RepID=UPI001EFE569D|nr:MULTISPECIES: STAS domain-containing protein [unclassified Vibrio]MCG9596404.1 STAS domain-containing protein [Vibrio sp. Isolate25]MCG9681638.1 STAS domain-containing protein [Vibrio sp. Isolate23]